jgi:hypothetical protein
MRIVVRNTVKTRMTIETGTPPCLEVAGVQVGAATGVGPTTAAVGTTEEVVAAGRTVVEDASQSATDTTTDHRADTTRDHTDHGDTMMTMAMMKNSRCEGCVEGVVV